MKLHVDVITVLLFIFVAAGMGIPNDPTPEAAVEQSE